MIRGLVVGLMLPLGAALAATLAGAGSAVDVTRSAPAPVPSGRAVVVESAAVAAGSRDPASAAERPGAPARSEDAADASLWAARPSSSATEAGAAQEYPYSPYHGRFTFVRLRYEPAVRGFRGFGGGEPPWRHDYPRAERHFMRLLQELTYVGPYVDGGNVMWADDPELFKFPLAYMSEPGFWTQTDEEVAGLRAYLRKGGFLIFDDFRGPHWYNFERELKRVLPDAQLVELDASHPIFHSFFEIESLDLAPPTFRGYPPAYYGVFEDNDPNERLMVIANYNNDIGEYWEWSNTGWLPIDLSNEAYKLGINYVVYAMTH